MPNQEEQITIIRDIVLPADYNTRYDIYFTDTRIAIVCMGSIDRYRSEQFNVRAFPASSSAVSPPLTYIDQRKTTGVEEELSKMPLDDILKLSKKSCYYTYEEIESVRLAWGKKPKFGIFSADSESKFSPDEDQFKQLLDLLTTFEPLCDKLVIAGYWKELQTILAKFVCGNCGVENDLDAICCVNCGQKLKEQPEQQEIEDAGIPCSVCGKTNMENASFCKQCGAKLAETEENAKEDEL